MLFSSCKTFSSLHCFYLDGEGENVKMNKAKVESQSCNGNIIYFLDFIHKANVYNVHIIYVEVPEIENQSAKS